MPQEPPAGSAAAPRGASYSIATLLSAQGNLPYPPYAWPARKVHPRLLLFRTARQRRRLGARIATRPK